MSIQKVSYEDKVDLQIWASIPNTNKIKADDMNEIKGAINENADELSSAKDMVASQDSEIEALMNALPSESKEGENINIKGTIPVKFKEFKVSGNSKQETSDTMPSPEYPSEIQNVEGNIDITVCNKNLFDKNKVNVINGYFTTSNIISEPNNRTIWIKCKPNTIYTVQKKAGQRFAVGFTEEEPIIGSSVQTPKTDNYGNKITNTSLENSKYIIVYVANYNIGTEILWQDILDSLQIEESPIATEYVEHQSQTITFPLQEGQKLMQGDYLAADGIHHKRKQIELDGTDFSLYSSQVAGRTIYLISNFSNNNNFKTYDSSILCNILKQGTSSQGDNYLNNNGSSGSLYVSIENSILGITDESTNEEKLQAFQNLIAETGFVYEGELAEEEIEPYTEEQQEAYNQLCNLTAYEEETNVYSTNEVSPIFSVTAVKDINSVITQLNQLILEGGK